MIVELSLLLLSIAPKHRPVMKTCPATFHGHRIKDHTSGHMIHAGQVYICKKGRWVVDKSFEKKRKGR